MNTRKFFFHVKYLIYVCVEYYSTFTDLAKNSYKKNTLINKLSIQVCFTVSKRFNNLLFGVNPDALFWKNNFKLILWLNHFKIRFVLSVYFFFNICFYCNDSLHKIIVSGEMFQSFQDDSFKSLIVSNFKSKFFLNLVLSDLNLSSS